MVWNQKSEIYEGIWVDDAPIGTFEYTDTKENTYSGYVVKECFQLERAVQVKFSNGVSYEGLFEKMPAEMQEQTGGVFKECLKALH